MRHTTSKKIFTYWNNLRGNRPAPDRCEIEPSDIRDILGDTFILEIDPKYRAISFRLAGTRLCNAYGRELKGVGFLALWDETDNMNVLSAVRGVYESSKPASISYVAESQNNRSCEYEMLLLPLQNSSSSSIRLLGTASPTHNENWIGSDALTNNRLKSARSIDITDAENTPPIETNLDAGARFQNYTSSDGSAPRRVAHLTVFEGGIVD